MVQDEETEVYALGSVEGEVATAAEAGYADLAS
jgi:hypothetical protein